MSFKRLLPALAAAFAAALLAACETMPVTPEEAARVNYGPAPVKWQDTIRAYLMPKVNDAGKVIIEFKAGPKQLFQRETTVRKEQYGWAVCVWVNDRTWQGQYEGFYPMTVFIRNEQIVVVNNGPEDFGVIGSQYAKRQCAELGAPPVP
jgi:hypothetical protein